MTNHPEMEAGECAFATDLLRQHVAHSMGLADQDAVESLRNVSVIANAATAAALAGLLNGNDARRAKEALFEAREAVSAAGAVA
jgi:hypothetical protein